ncbi:phage major capsid protein [Arthrobacter jiangjiafuii]|uniref:Phage major capsid protein n=1 Tax=Arthrobacter jiangjiafuii TaxID=2817475 RepID=A0A975R1C0_9MICC|nr:phage major capsid protein [Arthrobacter jiangjiafuii]MBP3044882.1 phage major capsid protein [Arthrobacter jiangjiafuii]QWC10294.1 phage major capsid protein [Arthrobacter jiangjiafuii]
MAGIDVNRSTSGIVLTPEQSAEIWSAAEYASAVMQLAQKVDLPGSGVSVPIITGEPEADWVNETDEKPVSRPTFDNKIMTPYTAAVIVPFSNQFKRDKAGLYNEIVRKLPQALARKFDATVFGLQSGAPGSNFDTLGGAPQVGIGGDTYAGLVAADQSVAAGGGILNGWALSPQARGLLLGAVDSTGRPLFTGGVAEGNVPTLLGAPTAVTKGVYAAGADGAARLGFAGDWTSAHYGVVENIQLDISDQATITDGAEQLNLWQRNMFAVRVEFEVGFRVRDIAHFAQLTNATQA